MIFYSHEIIQTDPQYHFWWSSVEVLLPATGTKFVFLGNMTANWTSKMVLIAMSRFGSLTSTPTKPIFVLALQRSTMTINGSVNRKPWVISDYSQDKIKVQRKNQEEGTLSSRPKKIFRLKLQKLKQIIEF